MNCANKNQVNAAGEVLATAAVSCTEMTCLKRSLEGIAS